jgi:hypothetical protein
MSLIIIQVFHILIFSTTILIIHLELGRQWKVIIFHIYFVNKRVRIFKTKNLYGNDT